MATHRKSVRTAITNSTNTVNRQNRRSRSILQMKARVLPRLGLKFST